MRPMKKSPRVGFIGAGNMAQALISGMLRKGHPPRRILTHDVDPSRPKALAKRFGVASAKNIAQVLKDCEIVVLAVKPQDLKKVLGEIASLVKNHLIVSIAAGVDCETLTKNLKSGNKNAKFKLIRAMPNNPALIGEGITVLSSSSPLSRKEIQTAERLFEGAGEVLWVRQESLLDAVTGLSGSGPAYLYRFVEGLAVGGEKAGLPSSVAYRLALKTVLGAALTLEKTGRNPSQLIPLVASKKGTTLEGLKVLKKSGFDRILIRTVHAASKRAREIRKEMK
jgi:pyrroline-5-carboxylate reductase